VIVPTVQKLGDEAVFGRVSGQVGVQKIDRYPSLDAHLIVLPDADVDVSPADLNGDLKGERLHKGAGIEIGVEFFLCSHGIDGLNEVAPLVEQSHCNQRKTKVCRGFDVISSQNPETAAVGRDVFVETDLHAEIRNFHEQPSLTWGCFQDPPW